MLRPERMSRVSVTGSKRVLEDVVAAAYDLNLVHLVDYDGSWEGFDPGDPVGRADEVSDQLVTVRSIESILGVDEDGVESAAEFAVDDADVEAEIESIRAEVNELDDRRSALREERRELEERLDAAEAIADVGIDLDLLSGYDSLVVRVGHGDATAIEEALGTADPIDAYELFAGEDAVAVVAHPGNEDALDEALVGVEFADLPIPDAEGAPDAYVRRLEDERDRIETDLAEVEAELEELKTEAARFLIAVEERLTAEVQKAEAPLRFATTENAFIAEGWIPSDRYREFESAITAVAGGSVDIEELQRAEYDRHGHPTQEGHGPGDAAVADGGTAMDENPPVLMENPTPAKPFELLVQAVDLPRYDEFDPTVILWLTFPVFFGFMIGDVGYGILYMAIGYWLYRRFDAPGFRALGGVALWSGGFTLLFGLLYGELFGLHQIGEFLWGTAEHPSAGLIPLGGPPIHKGLQPAEIEYAKAWLVITVLVGIAHVTLGYVLSFAKDLRHGLKDAVLESGSWALMMLGLWGWVFSTHYADRKPAFLVGPESIFNGHPFALGFTGFPEVVGMVGAGAFVLGLVMIWVADWVEGVEALFLQVLVRALSYTRIAAVLLAKAGMAFVVNLLVFGVYTEETGHGTAFHFLFFSDHHVAEEAIVFSGVLNAGSPLALVVGVLAGVLIFVLGHAIVLGLGVTSAGLQAVRLEYVEFFNEFYDGGGDPYRPFGSTGRSAGEE